MCASSTLLSLLMDEALLLQRERERERDRQTGREMAKRPKKSKIDKTEGVTFIFLNKDVTGARDGNRKLRRERWPRQKWTDAG